MNLDSGWPLLWPILAIATTRASGQSDHRWRAGRRARLPPLHPRLLYAAFGRSPDGDAYTIDGYGRNLAKSAWQILINASSRRSALVAVAQELGGLCRQAEAGDLLSALELRHGAISAAFYTGEGLRLQRTDSDLMMRIGLRCISEGIVALPVHDSCIVRARHSSRTQEIMDLELSATLKSAARS